MLRSEKEIRNENWEELFEVNTGELFAIQNTSSSSIFYVELDYFPSEDIRGNILEPSDVLRFKRANGNLYIRRSNDNGFIAINHIPE